MTKIIQVVGSLVITLMLVSITFLVYPMLDFMPAKVFLIVGESLVLLCGYYAFWGAGLFKDN